MSTKVSLNIEAGPDSLERINDAVESISVQEEWPNDLLFTTTLVLEELALNVVNHAYGGRQGEFQVIITSEDESLTIEIVGSGPEFNVLTDSPVPDVDAIIEDRPVGGLGVYLVKSMMDELHYKREEDRNHIIAIKRRNE